MYCAGAALGATLVAAAWLYTYRVSRVVQYVEYIDGTPREFRAADRLSEQPWWGAPATVALILVGTAVSLWLLPERRRIIDRALRHFAKPSYY